MTPFIQKVILSFTLLCMSAFANATLITNGSFEQTTFHDNTTSIGAIFNTNLQDYDTKTKGWDVFNQLPGWVTSYGNGIELQKNIVTSSQQGSNHVELDSHRNGFSNAVMTQTLKSLVIGNDYLLEFFYKPRTNTLNDNGINVYWYDAAVDFNIDMKAVLVADGTRNATPNWVRQSVMFTAKAESMNLSFGAFGKQNTLGGLLDNVSLNNASFDRATAVPEPSMLLLFLSSLAFLGLRSKKRLN